MGGRGASSGGVGRAPTSGLKHGDILGTTSLMSARERQQQLVDETMSVFMDVHGSYGTVMNDIQLAELKPNAQNTLGFYDGANIAINQTFFDKAKMDKAYADSVKSGYHPSNGNKTALQAVVAHEIGHKLTDQVGVKLGNKEWADFDKTARQIVNEARRSTGHKGVVQMASKISKYATSSNAEAIAEAFSDVYCNGSGARRESKAIVDVLNKYLK